MPRRAILKMMGRIRYPVEMMSLLVRLDQSRTPPGAHAAARITDACGILVRGAGDDGGEGTRPPGDDGQVGVATKTRAKPKKPSQFKVLMLNDDYTPMEFVVLVLKRFFHMDLEQATRVMLHVHQRGVGVCGIFPYEIAETKVNQVMDFAKQNQHPLQCTLEKA
jgi:ATP-dependent Clp protease adaptor protein ClpS